MAIRYLRLFSTLSGLALLALLGLIGWATACTAGTVEAPVAQVQAPAIQADAYDMYLGSWVENNDDGELKPLVPKTLEAQMDGNTLEPGTFSADGSTRVTVEYPEGHSVNSRNLDPEDVWIVVYDLSTGVERRRFHPPVTGLVLGTSADGSRLLMQPFPYPISSYPPPVEWYVLDTTSGDLLAHIRDDDNACFRQSAILDPSGESIYCAVDPDLTGATTPRPLQIVVYDVSSGLPVQDIELRQVLLGGSQREHDGRSVWELLEPAITLSPDGGRLAVVHADADKITLINAHSLSVDRTITLQPDMASWDWFGLAPKVAQAKGEMKGTIRQAVFSHDGQRLYLFTQELWVEPENAPAERGLWAVDLAQGRLLAKALPDYQIQWVRAAPDGTIFAFGTTDERLMPYEIRETSPSTLWRLDDRTLEILAERSFSGYRSGWLIVTAEPTTDPQTNDPD